LTISRNRIAKTRNDIIRRRTRFAKIQVGLVGRAVGKVLNLADVVIVKVVSGHAEGALEASWDGVVGLAVGGRGHAKTGDIDVGSGALVAQVLIGDVLGTVGNALGGTGVVGEVVALGAAVAGSSGLAGAVRDGGGRDAQAVLEGVVDGALVADVLVTHVA